MCGIIGIVSKTEAVADPIFEGLRRLEYRGYDSAGIATLKDNALHRRRAEGKLSALQQVLAESPLAGNIGIGHTRWATHGAPTQANAHPHIAERVAVVHNGIIENYKSLKEELIAGGAAFTSDTDTEVIAHLFTRELDNGASIEQAAQQTFTKLEGAYALGLIISGEEDIMIASRHGSPLAIGTSATATYIGSDAFALAPFTNKITYLQDGDWAVLRADSAHIYNVQGEPQTREQQIIDAASQMVDKGNHRHFMAKEIHEQAEVLSRSVGQYVDTQSGAIIFPQDTPDYSQIEKIYLVACGTGYFAAQIARHWIERYAKIPAEIDIASEFRYRDFPISKPLEKNTLAVFISQSGETADTLAALEKCKAAKIATLGVVNVPNSSITREADTTFPTYAGAEIGVASTKAFMAQLVALSALAIGLARTRNALTAKQETELTAALLATPRLANEVLHDADKIETLARTLTDFSSVLFIGRGTMWAMAQEGALKFKELSYIHAEAFAAGELKHGSIALIDEMMPTIALAPSTADTFEKTISNMQEVMARGGAVYLISDAAGVQAAGQGCAGHITLPTLPTLPTPTDATTADFASDFVSAFVYAIPMQLLAYYAATALGTDVDQPRNLAKSVTVE